VPTSDLNENFFVALSTSRKKIWRVSAADRNNKKCLDFYNGHFCLASFFREIACEQFHVKGFSSVLSSKI